MGCCGKTDLIDDILENEAAMASGLFATINPLPVIESRLAYCRKCEQATIISKEQYLAWLRATDRFVPDPISIPDSPSRFCKKAMLFLPIILYNTNSKCPLDKWDRGE